MTAQIPEVEEICLYLLGHKNLTPQQRRSMSESWGFKNRCVQLLSSILGVSTSYIWHWGQTVNFENMPAKHKASLNAFYLTQIVTEQEALIRKQRDQIDRLQIALNSRRVA